MTNKVKDVRIKDHTYCFFNDIINIKSFDLNNIKRDEKKKSIIYYIAYATIKNSKYVKINRVTPLYLIFSKIMDTLKKFLKII